MGKRQREEITSESESYGPAEESEDDFFESPEEKKIRLAKEVIEKLGPVARATPEKTTAVHAQISFGSPTYFRGHHASPTCACVGPEGSVFTGGKDGAVLRWNLQAESKEVILTGLHKMHVSAVAYHPKADALVTCGNDLFVTMRRLSNLEDATHMKGHQQPPAALAVNPGGDLDVVFSTGPDKQLRQWSLTHGASLKTLYGHTQAATSLGVFSKDRPVTGGEDATVRAFKVEGDTHLVFNLDGTRSIDAVACVSGEFVVVGTQSGDIMLLSTMSKKPVDVVRAAHGGNWIQSLCSIPGTNIILSGSHDGNVHVWRAEETSEGRKKSRRLRLETSIPVEGFVNAIVVTSTHIVACVGRDGRLGRWETLRAKNGVVVVPFTRSD